MIEKSRFTDPFADKTTKVEPPETKKPTRGSRYERNRVARLMAVQATYDVFITHTPYDRVMKTFLNYHFKNHTHPFHPDRELFMHWMMTLEARTDQLAEIISNMTTEAWSSDNMDLVLKAILTVGAAEILMPYKNAPLNSVMGVVISEYVEIAKGFFEDKEAAYVNKALDAVAKKLL